MDNVSRLIISKFLGSWYFTVPIQTLFFFAKGLTFAQIMLLESVLLVGILLFEIPTGILGDRMGRKWSLGTGAGLGEQNQDVEPPFQENIGAAYWRKLGKCYLLLGVFVLNS